MTTRRVSLLVGLLCLIASMSVAAAPPASSLIDGKISGQEVCWQDLCGFAHFFGTFNGKVSGEHTTGLFSAIVQHESPLPTQPGATVKITSGSWYIWTKMGNFAGTVSGTLTAKKNERFDVTLTLPITTPAGYSTITLTFIGVLDHSGLDKEPIPELPTIMGDIF